MKMGMKIKYVTTYVRYDLSLNGKQFCDFIFNFPEDIIFYGLCRSAAENIARRLKIKKVI